MDCRCGRGCCRRCHRGRCRRCGRCGGFRGSCRLRRGRKRGNRLGLFKARRSRNRCVLFCCGLACHEVIHRHQDEQYRSGDGIKTPVEPAGCRLVRVAEHLNGLLERGRHSVVVGDCLIRIQTQILRIGLDEPAIEDTAGQQLECFVFDCRQKSRADASFCRDFFQRKARRLSRFPEVGSKIRHSWLGSCRSVSSLE